ncbi:MAG TPA: penicillin-binding protein 2 [Paenalcaligenes sp.]|nr:penicillin-binding protein 2 [Paenalcaligenes sp.]
MKPFGFYENPVLEEAMPQWRARFVMLLLLLSFGALLIKALYLQGLSTQFLQEQGVRRFERTMVLPPNRGKVFDRSGKVVLASSVPVKAIWVIPEDANKASPEQVQQLAQLLEMPAEEVRKRMQTPGRSFVYLRRQVDLELAEQIADLGVPGVHQQDEMRRFYPEGESAAHVLGFTDIEDQGLEGIELAFNDLLSGEPGSRRVMRDRLGRIVDDVREVIPPMHGEDLFLSIDAGVQYDAYSALKKALDFHDAEAGSAVVLDVRTGEILALVNLPTYNPNDRNDRTGDALRNRVITDTFEPGSIMKPFTVALALESGAVDLDTQFDTGNGRYRYEGAVISDVSRNGVLDVAGIIRRSSNIGMTMISERMSSEQMWDGFDRLGFGHAPQLGFPGAASGRLRPWDSWRPIERATMAYGYGMSSSLMQIAQAFTVFARDGDMVSLSLLRRDSQPTSTRVFSPEIAQSMRSMLEAAAGPEGTRRAAVHGYRVAGKSGTARKIVDGAYSKSSYRSSFVGFAPVSDPQIVVAVSVDEPRREGYFGGLVAAPVFSEVVAGSLRRLGVQPDAPVESLVALDVNTGGGQ